LTDINGWNSRFGVRRWYSVNPDLANQRQAATSQNSPAQSIPLTRFSKKTLTFQEVLDCLQQSRRFEWRKILKKSH